MRQLRRLPTRMSGVLGGQLLSPVAASARLCQQNSNRIPGLHSLMGGLLMRAPAPPPSRASVQAGVTSAPCVGVTRESNTSRHVRYGCCCSVSTNTFIQVLLTCPSPTTQSRLSFWLSSSRSRRSMLCSPAPWSTCSPSSIRALKSSASWSVPTLRSSETI